MDRRPRSASAHPAPGPAKRRRPAEPAGAESRTAPTLHPPAEPRAGGALTSVVVLAPGCALQLPLDGVHLLLEPEPTSVLQVSLGEHTFLLVPETLLGSADGRSGPQGLDPGAVLGAPRGHAAVQQRVLRARAPEMAGPEEARGEDAEPEALPPAMGPEAGSGAGLRSAATRGAGFSPHSPVPEPAPRAPTRSPERCSPGPDCSLDFLRLLEPFPSSPLQPLPPSPSPGPQARAQRPPGPAPKARRRLFQE